MARALIAFCAFAGAAGLSATSTRVTVLGGSGYVGARVCEKLVEGGCSVRSVSRSGGPPVGAGSWASSVEWVANDLTRGSVEALEAAVGSPEVVVSCAGSIGFDGRGNELGNGVANAAAASALATCAPDLRRYVYVSVADEVAACADGWFPGYMSFYFSGKKDAERAIVECVGRDNAYFVKPGFIYGGDVFGLFPPRVTSGYGSAIEELLSSGVCAFLADKLPGLLGVAFRPPVAADAVAAAIVGLALGTDDSAELDGTAAINAAAGAPKATGLSDFIAGAKAKVKEATA